MNNTNIPCGECGIQVFSNEPVQERLVQVTAKIQITTIGEKPKLLNEIRKTSKVCFNCMDKILSRRGLL